VEQRYSKVALLLTDQGICKSVQVDGRYIDNVAEAKIIMGPGDVTRLVLDIFVSDVETIIVPA
jgi:hypothetical protein